MPVCCVSWVSLDSLRMGKSFLNTYKCVNRIEDAVEVVMVVMGNNNNMVLCIIVQRFEARRCVILP